MSEFLETVKREFNLMRARTFAGDGYEGVTHAGIAIVACDTGLVLMAQRAMDETDDPEVQESWEFPGGALNEGEEPFPGAVRELLEETYLPLPEGMVVNGWRASNGVYQGFVYTTPTAFSLEGWLPTKEVQAVAWVPPRANRDMKIRPELADFDWALLDVSGNEEVPVDDETVWELEPEFEAAYFAEGPIPVHGILAPEEVETGDQRGFNAGSMTARPLRLPFSWQKVAIGGHDGSVVVGSVDRLMRKDGMIHWEGALMPSAESDEFAGMLAFFGRFGVSVDGDSGSLDAEKTEATGVMWFDAVRASGLTAVAIPAFHEAYVAFGPHPDMPAEFDDALVASGSVAGARVTFDRGPGWVTNPKETKTIHDYWTRPGEPGYEKIGWGTPGDFRRAKTLIGEKIAKNSPEKMKYLNQIIAQWHFDALGYWPGDLGKPGNAPDTPENRRRAAEHAAGGETVEFRDVPTEERKRLADEGAALPDGSFPIANCEDLRNAIQAIGRAKDPAKAKAHIRKRKSALGCTDVDLPETWAVSGNEEGAWEVVLTSSAGQRVLPPLSYFDRHEDSGALVVEEPDEFGIRRTYGYAGERGVCHIGINGRCVEPPMDMGDDYASFHLGRTKTDEGYINTGLITYKVEHRDADTILAQTPQQAHFDDISNAWAAVRIGEDERGIWFSGVVLPHVDEDDLTLIEASGQVSGEWLYGALRTLLTVGVPGFPVIRSSAAFDDEGNVVALAASAFSTVDNGTGESECSPRSRMASLRDAYATVRMDDFRRMYENRLVD